MPKIYRLSSDIFNIAVWSNRDQGKKKVGCFKRFIFTLIAAIVIVAQVQISFTIIQSFLDDIQDHHAKLAKWNAELFVSTIACFFITAVQIFSDSKDRIVVMSCSSNPIFWMLSFVSYSASCLVSVAVFLTIYQQETVNDLWFNYAGLLVIIQIDDLMGAWACSYMLDDEVQESDDFLAFKASELQLKVAQKMVLVLMAFYVIWTISLYRVYKQVGEHEITIAVDKYEKVAKKMADKAKDQLNKGIANVLEIDGSGGAPSSLNLASLDQDRSSGGALHDLLDDYQSGFSLNTLANIEVSSDSSIVSLDATVQNKTALHDANKAVKKTQKYIMNIVLFTCPIVVAVMFLWPVGLLLLRCCHGLCCCCRKKEEEEQDDFQKQVDEVHEQAHHSMKEKAEQQQGIIAALEEQVTALMERANAISEKASVAIN